MNGSVKYITTWYYFNDGRQFSLDPIHEWTDKLKP